MLTFAAMDWNSVAAMAAVVGLLLTGIGLICAAVQLRMSRKIAASQFTFQLFELIQQYNDIHMRLTVSGWPNDRDGPITSEEWSRIGRYMGLLEVLQQLVDDGIVSIRRVDKDYSHRVLPLVTNKAIHQRFLVEENVHWTDFIRLWNALEMQRVYRFLVSKQKDFAEPAHAPEPVSGPDSSGKS